MDVQDDDQNIESHQSQQRSMLIFVIFVCLDSVSNEQNKPIAEDSIQNEKVRSIKNLSRKLAVFANESSNSFN